MKTKVIYLFIYLLLVHTQFRKVLFHFPVKEENSDSGLKICIIYSHIIIYFEKFASIAFRKIL